MTVLIEAGIGAIIYDTVEILPLIRHRFSPYFRKHFLFHRKCKKEKFSKKFKIPIAYRFATMKYWLLKAEKQVTSKPLLSLN